MQYKTITFDKIPSTQTYAHELVSLGTATDHTAIVAAAQSSGRGRYRRKWVSHHGNLYVSFIFASRARDPRLSYAVAVAIAETLIAFGVTAQIKWPNDVMADEKKISGTLIEYAKNFVIVGIGINIATNPTVKNYETTKTDNYAVGLNGAEILAVLMKKIDAWMWKLERGKFADVRARWLQLATHIGSEIQYQGAPATMMGINDDGALVLRRGSEYILVFGDEIIM